MFRIFVPLAVLIVFMSTSGLRGQTFSILYAFTNGVDGAGPVSSVLLSSNRLYGGTSSGGRFGYGTLYSVNTDGTGFSVLDTMTNAVEGLGLSSLTISGNNLFGTTQQGGSNFQGTIFSANINGTNFNTLHVLSGENGDGTTPDDGLVLAGSTLYGTGCFGGINNEGGIFSINIDGTGFTNFYSFNLNSNENGADPLTGLCLSGNTLYGTTGIGGTNADGTIFSINTDGSDFTTLHNFIGGTNDGSRPMGRLVLSGGTLYGTTYGGGAYGPGIIFSLNTNGTGYTILHSFSDLKGDGDAPESGLTLSGDALFGMTCFGGTGQVGTLFMLNTNGSNFTILHNFNRQTEGANPQSDLAFSGSTLYGTLAIDGSKGYGSVFGLTIVPNINTMQQTGNNLTFSSTMGLAGHVYTLLSGTNLAMPITQWLPVATNVLTASGNFVMTATNVVNNAVSQQFFILQVQ